MSVSITLIIESDMVMMKHAIYFTCLAAFLAGFYHKSFSQDSTTLESMIRQTLERNPRLLSAQLKTTGAHAKIRQATAWEDPVFSFEFFQTPATSINPFKDGMENDYSIQQMIPFPGKKPLMGEMASWNAQMVATNRDAVRRQLVADVTVTYAMLYSAQRRLEINHENQQTLLQVLENARSRYAVGMGTQADLLTLRVELEKVKLDETRLVQEHRSALAMLNALRAMPHGSVIGRLAEPVVRAPADNADELLSLALRSRPELLGMTAEIEMRKADYRLQQKERLPDFMVRGMYKQLLMDLPDYWALMVGITVPIAPWSSGKYAGRIEETEADVLAAEQSYQDMTLMVEFEVRDALLKAQSLWRQGEQYRSIILPQTEQAFRAALAQYQTNATGFATLLDALRMVQMYSMERVMIEAEYVSALARLEHAVGSDLSASGPSEK